MASRGRSLLVRLPSRSRGRPRRHRLPILARFYKKTCGIEAVRGRQEDWPARYQLSLISVRTMETAFKTSNQTDGQLPRKEPRDQDSENGKRHVSRSSGSVPKTNEEGDRKRAPMPDDMFPVSVFISSKDSRDVERVGICRVRGWMGTDGSVPLALFNHMPLPENRRPPNLSRSPAIPLVSSGTEGADPGLQDGSGRSP